MTPDLSHGNSAEDDTDQSAGPAQTPAHRFAVSPPPATSLPNIPARPATPPAVPGVPVLAAAPSGPEHPGETARPATGRHEPAMEPMRPAEAPAPAPAHAPEPAPPPTAEAPAPAAHAPEPAEAKVETGAERGEAAATEAETEAENGDEAVHTLLWTAATERPVEEVASLVARLKETGQVSSPADVALRAAAVSRPLDEVRQLLALLNASGYDLRQAETTLRAAAVGRSIEDVVRLVNILGTDSSDWRPAGGGLGEGEERKAAPGRDEGVKHERDAVPVIDGDKKRPRGAAKGTKSVLDGALATGPGSHTASPALRSALRWPAAIALFACGLIHVPLDIANQRLGGNAEMLSLVVTIVCLLCAVWLAVRDTLIVWAAAAGFAVGVIAIHGLASARIVDLLDSSLGSTFTWAKATALLSAVAVVLMAASAVVRHTRTTSAPDSV
ncbi:hypothetical protein ACF05T_07790 [Streptomyces lateritius]|uniref:Uncharacterized protein n=1 Tax=Streptomyces lateritius TaxID=67313 RepID=A0ABW6Y8T7_9ACTN